MAGGVGDQANNDLGRGRADATADSMALDLDELLAEMDVPKATATSGGVPKNFAADIDDYEAELEALLAQCPDGPLTAEESARFAREYGITVPVPAPATSSAATATTAATAARISGAKRKLEPETALLFKAPDGTYTKEPKRHELTGPSGAKYYSSFLRYELVKDEPSHGTGPT